MSTKITAKQASEARALLAAFEKQAKAKPSKPKKVWTDKKGRTFKQARKAHYKARQNRWTNGDSASSGMTRTQRQAVAAKLPYGYSQKQWDKACLKFKAGGFR